MILLLLLLYSRVRTFEIQLKHSSEHIITKTIKFRAAGICRSVANESKTGITGVNLQHRFSI